MRAEFKESFEELTEEHRDNHDTIRYMEHHNKKGWKTPDLTEAELVSIIKTVDYLYDDGNFPKVLYPYLEQYKSSPTLLENFNENQWVYHEVKDFIICFNMQDVVDGAAEKGRLDWIQFARKLGYDIYDICNAAVKYGQLDILNEYSSGLSFGHALTAAERGHTEFLKYLVAEKGIRIRGVMSAAQSGNLETFRWVCIHCVYSQRELSIAASIAIENGHLFILEYLVYIRGVLLTNSALSLALISGDIALIKWVRNRMYLQQGNAVLLEAKYIPRISVEILRWLHREIPSALSLDNLDFCTYASRYGKLSTLKLLRGIGCSWNPVYCLAEASYNGHKNIVKYILLNTIVIPTGIVILLLCVIFLLLASTLEILRVMSYVKNMETRCEFPEGGYQLQTMKNPYCDLALTLRMLYLTRGRICEYLKNWFWGLW
jgi:hypothetical protein